MNNQKARSLSPSRRALTWRASLGRLRASATALAGISAFAFGAPLALRAQSNSAWSTNPVSVNFTGINWTLGTTTPGAPTGTIAAGDNLYFGATATGFTALNNDELAGFSIGSFTFNAGASVYTIAGNSFALGAGGITNNSTSLQTINAAFTMAATSTFTTITGGGNLALGGEISGAGGLTKNGAGTLTLTDLGTYTGATNVNGGTLELAGDNGGLYGYGQIAGIINVNAGATLRFSGNDTIGNSDVAAIPVTVTVTGGTLTNTAGFYTSITNVNLNGATITDNGGPSTGFASFRLGGTVTISGTTATNINVGTASATNGINLGTYTVNDATTFNVGDVTGNATSDLNVNDVFRNSGSSTNGLIKSGLGTMTLTVASVYTGGTIVNAGTLALGIGNAAGAIQGAVTVNSGATLSLTAGDALGYNNDGTQVTAVNLVGGTLTASVGNQGFYTNFNLTGGGVSGTSLIRFNVNGGAAQPSITSLASGTTSTFANPIDAFANNNVAANLAINVADGAAPVDLQITGSIFGLNGNVLTGINKNGPGYLNLTGQNTFNGPVNVTAGTVNVGTAAANAGSSGALGLSTGGKTITVSSGATLSGTVNNWFGNQANTGTLPAITVNGGLLSTQRYTTVGALNLNGATVSNASIESNASYQAFAFRGNVTVGGTSASTISATTPTGTTRGYHLGANTLFTVANAVTGTDLTVSAPLRNQSGDFGDAAGGLTKAGLGTMLLSGANTYTGATAVNAGTLLVNGSTAGASAVTVNNSGSVLGGSGGTISGATTINAGSTITGGDLGTVGALTLGSTVTLNGGTFAVDISGATADRLTIAGALSLTSATITFTGTPTAPSYVLATFASATGSFSGTAPSGYVFQFNNPTTPTELDLVAVPEPATWAAGCLLFGLVGVSQRRKIGAVLAAARG